MNVQSVRRIIFLLSFMAALVVNVGLSMSLPAVICAQEIAGIKCVVSGQRSANRDFKSTHADGEIYFCCGNCKKAFEETPGQFTTKANHQMVLTGQYVQKSCPISGGAVSADHTTAVGGVEIGYCCGKCQAKVAALPDMKSQAEAVFGQASFKKNFAKKEIDLSSITCPVMPAVNVKAKLVAEYNGGSVYFCCPKCLKKFSEAPDHFAAKANHQLVKTGQFVQTACPITGGAIKPNQSAMVGDVEVGICCGNCKSKIENAATDKQIDLVFGTSAFAKGFAMKSAVTPAAPSVSNPPAE